MTKFHHEVQDEKLSCWWENTCTFLAGGELWGPTCPTIAPMVPVKVFVNIPSKFHNTQETVWPFCLVPVCTTSSLSCMKFTPLNMPIFHWMPELDTDPPIHFEERRAVKSFSLWNVEPFPPLMEKLLGKHGRAFNLCLFLLFRGGSHFALCHTP